MKPTTTVPADLLVLGPNGVGIAAIDVQNPRDFSLEVAKEYRRSAWSPGPPYHLPYYLLASQDVGYLWTGDSEGDPDADPVVEIPLTEVTAHYTPDLKSGERLRPSDFELLLWQWLFGITQGLPEATGFLGNLSDSPRLKEFVNDLRGARIAWVTDR